jgi:hypothetical protein
MASTQPVEVTSTAYLLIFTRHPGTDSSARYLLRHAANLVQSGHEITVFLRGRASCTSGERIVRQAGIEAVFRMKQTTAADLALRMLQPGLETYWC